VFHDVDELLTQANRIKAPDPKVNQWVAVTPPLLFYVSAITLSEIRFGIELLADSQRRRSLERWLEQDLHGWFKGGRWTSATVL
jgi:predicted nucleic acid-binding protein